MCCLPLDYRIVETIIELSFCFFRQLRGMLCIWNDLAIIWIGHSITTRIILGDRPLGAVCGCDRCCCVVELLLLLLVMMAVHVKSATIARTTICSGTLCLLFCFCVFSWFFFVCVAMRLFLRAFCGAGGWGVTIVSAFVYFSCRAFGDAVRFLLRTSCGGR